MNYELKEVAERLKGLRNDCEMTTAEIAGKLGISQNEYEEIESGSSDFSITTIYKCAEIFGVDLVEILTGDVTKLKKYSIVKNGKGLPVERRKGFHYQHMAFLFKNRKVQPIMVTAPFNADEQDKPITLSSHSGQEFDLVISGKLKVSIDGHIETLEAGDLLYYDSTAPHGMIAVGGEPCVFLAVLI
jgi:transcriptional regulator with XRE-family HTH domain